MKSSEILREAARRVELGKSFGGCFAIMMASRSYRDRKRASDFFRSALSRDTESGYWWPEHECYGPRIIGLCLAAAIAESEGD